MSDITAEAMKASNVEFSDVNVLADPEVYENQPRFANSPTFPQIEVNREMIGG